MRPLAGLWKRDLGRELFCSNNERFVVVLSDGIAAKQFLFPPMIL